MADRAKWALILVLALLLAACGPKDELPPPLDPEDAEQLERVYQEGRAAFLAGRYDEAAGHFARVADADPDHLRARINWGASLSRGGQPLAALGHFQRVLEQDPENAAAYYNWGAALVRLGRDDQALDKLDRARALGIEDLPPALRRSLDGYVSRQRRAGPEQEVPSETGLPR